MEDRIVTFVGKVLGVAMYAVAAYGVAVLIFFVALAVAGIFGYETPRQKQEQFEMRAFMSLHKRAFCHSERIPETYCDQLWHDSAEQHAAIVKWVRMKIERDKDDDTKSAYWNPLAVFTAPFQSDNLTSSAPWEVIPSPIWEAPSTPSAVTKR
jgi:hypothetical protein